MGSAGSLVSWGCSCQRGASGVCVIQEAGLGYKNDEKKDGLPDLWQCRAPCEFGPFRPLGSRSCSFTTHQTWLFFFFIGYRSSGSVKHCVSFITRYSFSEGNYT